MRNRVSNILRKSVKMRALHAKNARKFTIIIGLKTKNYGSALNVGHGHRSEQELLCTSQKYRYPTGLWSFT